MLTPFLIFLLIFTGSQSFYMVNWIDSTKPAGPMEKSQPFLDDQLLNLDEDVEYSDEGNRPNWREKKHEKERRGPKIWDQWGKWSPCSVTCGVGKIVRWRHCVSGGCSPGEKEAQIKTCTLPAC